MLKKYFFLYFLILKLETEDVLAKTNKKSYNKDLIKLKHTDCFIASG